MQPAELFLSSLAQAAQPAPAKPRSDTGGVFLWVLILIVVIMGGGLLLMWFKRRIFSADAGADDAGGLMDSLRQMRDSGQMSKEEYEATRKAMISRISKNDLGTGKGLNKGDPKSR